MACQLTQHFHCTRDEWCVHYSLYFEMLTMGKSPADFALGNTHLAVNFKFQEDRQCTYDVTMRRIRATIVAVQKQIVQ
jgi:hypothetical protein